MYKKVLARINVAALAAAVVAFSVYALSSGDAVRKTCATVGCWCAFLCLLTFGMWIAEALKNVGEHSGDDWIYGSDDSDDDSDD